MQKNSLQVADESLDRYLCKRQIYRMETYPTFSALIDALGGSAALADIIGRSVGTASAMKTRGTIPPRYWDAIVRHSASSGLVGVSHELLSRLYAERSEKVA